MGVDDKNVAALVILSAIILMVSHYLPLSVAWMASSPPTLKRLNRRSIPSHRHCNLGYGIASSSSLLLLSCSSKIDSLTALLASATTTPIMVEEERHGTNKNGDSSTMMTVQQQPTEPQLRGLYTSPPQVADKRDEDDDGWITQVTNGTMSPGDGSPHILYYEVHRRSYRNIMSPSSSSSTTTPSSTAATTQKKKKKKQGRLTALFLHGGPGAACNSNHVRFFNPHIYETVVLLDQRGCGRSVPLGEVKYNTLELLVDDIEQLRHIIFSSSSSFSSSDNDEEESITTTTTTSTRPWDTILGGSWGCTLAMAYAHTYPAHVRSMVLRGVCMFRTKEIDWLFGDPPLYDGDDSNNNNNSNNDAKRSNTANLRLLLEGSESGRGGRRSDTSSITTAPTNNDNVVTTGTTTVTTAAEVFPTGWDEFRKGSGILRPRFSPFSKQQRMTNAKQPTTTTTSRRDTLHRYYNLILGSTDPMVRNDAVKSWLRWEMGIYSSGFRNHRGPSTTTSTATQMEDEAMNNYNNTVLVWYPSKSSWSYEDTRVWNNDSFVSIGTFDNEMIREQPPPDKKMANSFRRFSSPSSFTTTSSLGLASLRSYDGGNLRPLPFHNTTTSPATYIPAQSMLTVFYSANDDYCIGRYKSFLSMERQQPQSSNDNIANDGSQATSFSSALPPEMPLLTSPNTQQFSNNPRESLLKSSTTSSFPLPPTIAIQGGNDAICPPDSALDLHEVWKEMELRIVLQSGHSMYDPFIAGEIVKALDRFGHSLIDT